MNRFVVTLVSGKLAEFPQCVSGSEGGEAMATAAQTRPRWTFSIFMIVLATSIPFVVEAVDPTLLSLHLPTLTQDLGIPTALVGFTGSLATLVMAAAVLGGGNLGDIYGYKRLLIYGLIGNIIFEVLTAFSPNYL